MDSKKKGKKKKKVGKPSQSSTTSTAVKSITPTADSFDPSKFISDKSKTYGEMWSIVSSDDRTKHMFVVKMLFCGPFLFNQSNSLSDQAKQKAVAMELLPAEGVWSMLLERPKFTTIKNIMILLDRMLVAMGEEVGFFQFLVDPEPYGLTEDQTNSGLLQYLKNRESSPDVIQLLDKEDTSLQAHMTIIKLQISDYILSLDLLHPELRVEEFFAERNEKEQQVAMVRERGNNNMKADKVKAAIADYTRAIRVCPYCSDLYYQRASCFKKSKERWLMVIESYRAIVTDPTNPRVYLLHADAWLEMGKEYRYAKEALATGQRMCKEGREELAKRYEQIEKLQKEHEEENERNWNEMKARKGLEEDKLVMEDPYKRKEALLQEELRMYSKKRPSMMEEKMAASDKNKGSIPYRSHKITLPDLGPIEFEQLDLPQLPSNVTLEKLLELANQTECHYLDVNQYLVYPSDEDSDDSIVSWGSGEDLPHYRQAAASGDGAATSEGSDFEELSCPSLVSDYEDEDITENGVTDKPANEVASHDQDVPPEDDTTSLDDVINNGVTKPDDVTSDNHGEASKNDDDVTKDVATTSDEVTTTNDDNVTTTNDDVTTKSNNVPSVDIALDSEASHELLTASSEAIDKAGSHDGTTPLDDLINTPESPDMMTSLLESVDPEATPPDSPDSDDTSLDLIKLVEPDPASLLPVIPPPVSHDQVTTPLHDQVTAPSLDAVTTLTESHDAVTSPITLHDTPSDDLDKMSSSHSGDGSSVASGDEVADLDLD
ncbi:uncharacterized protein [Dysidea avara]|uniref:uncharacterized protein isoform X2 n=1 Tax=Dysidea avara TaxID=196820 RepID=UPI0033249478